LSDDGVGVICGNWDEAGLFCLFHSIRKARVAATIVQIFTLTYYTQC
jgi:hypothetical protein